MNVAIFLPLNILYTWPAVFLVGLSKRRPSWNFFVNILNAYGWVLKWLKNRNNMIIMLTKLYLLAIQLSTVHFLQILHVTSNFFGVSRAVEWNDEWFGHEQSKTNPDLGYCTMVMKPSVHEIGYIMESIVDCVVNWVGTDIHLCLKCVKNNEKDCQIQSHCI